MPENLDCMDRTELLAVIERGTPVEYLEYALAKFSAMTFRLAGKIERAQEYKRFLETAYRQIPANLRW